jgi:hypothetical protein
MSTAATPGASTPTPPRKEDVADRASAQPARRGTQTAAPPIRPRPVGPQHAVSASRTNPRRDTAEPCRSQFLSNLPDVELRIRGVVSQRRVRGAVGRRRPRGTSPEPSGRRGGRRLRALLVRYAACLRSRHHPPGVTRPWAWTNTAPAPCRSRVLGPSAAGRAESPGCPAWRAREVSGLSGPA